MREDGSFEAAFDELFPRAVRLANRLLGDRAAAEDVAAEALARAYARWHKVSGLSYRDGWVLKVATNLAIDRLRRRRLDLTPPPAEVFEDAVHLRLALNAALLTLAPASVKPWRCATWAGCRTTRWPWRSASPWAV